MLGAVETLAVGACEAPASLLELTGGRGADVVVECTGQVGVWEAAPQLSTFDFYFRELRLVPSYSCGPVETRRALELIGAGVVHAEHVVTHRFPLDAAAAAYRVAAFDKAAIKTVVTFDHGA